MLRQVWRDRTSRGAVVVLLALAACATLSPREQVRDRLVAAGLRRPLADCMAEKLARNLTVRQLKQLGRAAQGAVPPPGHHVRVEVVLQQAATIHDPRIVEVATRAAIGCAIAG